MPITKLPQDEDGCIPEGICITKKASRFDSKDGSSIEFSVVRTASGKKVAYIHIAANIDSFDIGHSEDDVGTTFFYLSKAEVRKLCKILGEFAV